MDTSAQMASLNTYLTGTLGSTGAVMTPDGRVALDLAAVEALVAKARRFSAMEHHLQDVYDIEKHYPITDKPWDRCAPSLYDLTEEQARETFATHLARLRDWDTDPEAEQPQEQQYRLVRRTLVDQVFEVIASDDA